MTREALKRKYGDAVVLGVDANVLAAMLSKGFTPPDEAIDDAIQCNLKPMPRCEA